MFFNKPYACEFKFLFRILHCGYGNHSLSESVHSIKYWPSVARLVFAQYGKPTKRNIMYDREMHKIKCSDCGKESEVPFKPDGDRPVYCKDCYAKHRPPKRY